MLDEPSIAQAVAEVSREIKEFLHTRVDLLRSEFLENWNSWKTAWPLAGGAVVLLGTAYAFLAVALTCLIALFLPASFRWVIAPALIAFICGVPGALLAYVAIKRLRELPLIPKKTLDVLKDDRRWLEGGNKVA
jgi:uncharacterized membrane protein YqjE